MSRVRVPAGVRTGGQFAAHRHAEANVSLAPERSGAITSYAQLQERVRLERIAAASHGEARDEVSARVPTAQVAERLWATQVAYGY